MSLQRLFAEEALFLGQDCLRENSFRKLLTSDRSIITIVDQGVQMPVFQNL